MQKINVVKIFSLLIICVVFISFFSTIGTTTYHAFFSDDTFEKGTMIGPIDVSGLTEEDAKTALLSETDTWYDLAQISIVSGEETYILENRKVYHFDILKSVNSAIDGEQNPLMVNLTDEEFTHLINDLNQTKQHEIKSEGLKNGLLQPAQNLHPGEVVLNLAQFIKVDERNVVSQAIINNIRNESELLKWVKEFEYIDLHANTPFAILSFLKENDALHKYSNETLSMIATGIYSTVLPTNFEIVERYISDKMPSYAEFGKEALIEKEKKDLIIHNQNPHRYKLLFSLTDKGFEVQLTGAEMPQTISIVIKDEETFEPKIIQQFDSTLKKGQVVVKQKGIPGKIGKIFRNIKEKAQVDQHILIAQDYYPPTPKIEVHSILVPEVEQLTPSGQEQNIPNPDPNRNPPANESEDEQKNGQLGNDTGENQEDDSETDLWEDPDPLHLEKS